ncbi:MAG: alpha/beta hydrolase [Deltaproteobacteria bacterium]|nr:alpha/beta hydrolase [Deltaproteobacteria bacterium]
MGQSFLFIVALLWTGVVQAQVANMPKHVQDRLAEVGPVWGKDIGGNIEKTLEVYTPILRAAPKTGVHVIPDLSYGPEDRQKLDLYRPEGKSGVPMVVFLHGGAYVRGERNINTEVYANVATYFARQGLLGVNATYRLAPSAQWPAAAEDVGALVKWLKTNGSIYGGDAQRIYLIGHSAGATHVATYAYIGSLQPTEGPGIAGIVLMSGRYRIDPKPDDPSLTNVQAYFGTDTAQYTARSPINHVKNAAVLPTFLVIAEYDSPDLDVQGVLLFAALCERDRVCPRFTRMERHNHLSMVYQFNTDDDALGREILEFIRRGR